MKKRRAISNKHIIEKKIKTFPFLSLARNSTLLHSKENKRGVLSLFSLSLYDPVSTEITETMKENLQPNKEKQNLQAATAAAAALLPPLAAISCARTLAHPSK